MVDKRVKYNKNEKKKLEELLEQKEIQREKDIQR